MYGTAKWLVGEQAVAEAISRAICHLVSAAKAWNPVEFASKRRLSLAEVNAISLAVLAGQDSTRNIRIMWPTMFHTPTC
jgi:hypothetical protein